MGKGGEESSGERNNDFEIKARIRERFCDRVIWVRNTNEVWTKRDRVYQPH